MKAANEKDIVESHRSAGGRRVLKLECGHIVTRIDRGVLEQKAKYSYCRECVAVALEQGK